MNMEIDTARLMAALRHVQHAEGHLQPQWHPGDARGFTYFPGVDADAAGQMAEDLEYLAGTDYLDKVFFDRLTVCPACGSYHVNVREACTACKSPHVSSVTLLHHFRCGYVAPTDAFPRDAHGRTCPKCHGRLEHLGTDHDVPGDNFLCHSCHSSFQVPDVEGLCMSCRTRTPGAKLLQRDIFSFRLNSLGMAALNSGRLFEREDEQLLEGGGLPIYRRHVFMFLLEDEKRRAIRYGTPFSLVLLRFAGAGPVPAEQLVSHIAGNLRDSDKIGRFDAEHLMLLLPATDAAGSDIWLKRFMAGKTGGVDSLAARVIRLDLKADLAGQIATGMELLWTT